MFDTDSAKQWAIRIVTTLAFYVTVVTAIVTFQVSDVFICSIIRELGGKSKVNCERCKYSKTKFVRMTECEGAARELDEIAKKTRSATGGHVNHNGQTEDSAQAGNEVNG